MKNDLKPKTRTKNIIVQKIENETLVYDLNFKIPINNDNIMKTIFNLIIFVVLTLTTVNCLAANITSSRASIDMPGLTANPWAIIVATPIGDTETFNPNPIGVWYYSDKWNIFNTNQAVMAPGLKYKIQFFLKPGPNQFVHIMTQQNIGAEGSYIDHPALNNNPNAQFKILQVHAPAVRPYNPNRFKAKAEYSSAAGRWYITNINGEPLGRDCAYNIVITSGATVGSNTNTNEGTPTTPTGNAGNNPNNSNTNTPVGKPSPVNKTPISTVTTPTPPTGNASNNPIGNNPTASVVTSPDDPMKPTDLAPGSTKIMTGFDVKTHGFRFTNDFKNTPFGPPISVVTSGLCGGMSYAALDFYLAGLAIPKQTYRPAHSFVLQSYLYQRQETSLLENVVKWIDYHNNPFGSRNVEIFNWGLREQLAVLRTYIDRGVPVPLGLKWTGGDLVGKDHQVLAIGYDMGKYKGDVGSDKEDLKIFLSEPNYPGEGITLVVDESKLEFYYVEHPDVRWRSYFVDEKYKAKPPPTIPNPVEFQNQVEDGLVHALRFGFETGNVELRGGSLHIDLKILFTDGTEQNYQNISQSGRWLPKSTERLEIALTTPRRFEEIRSFVINTNSGHTGGIVVWEVERVEINRIGGGFNTYVPMKNPISPDNPFKFIGIPLYLFPK
jgi:hypothetical protein